MQPSTSSIGCQRDPTLSPKRYKTPHTTRSRRTNHIKIQHNIQPSQAIHSSTTIKHASTPVPPSEYPIQPKRNPLDTPHALKLELPPPPNRRA
ncbi:hypothetical protein BDV34DRAFT_205141 [Aspergillus parasiticus]|uniref:Uncharacterized protein n=1 Tax=Aspergillus parasiticus TaxID=5067 RepID=A0A5N6D4V6_ASPPA|nr:hypothetical protein BDV34DRAFT_205141 [Aspergillus parasiticus]